MKQIIHNEDGSQTVEIAHPSVCIFGVLDILRERTSRRIEQVAPPHDQINAALGLIDAGPICDAIQAHRDAFAVARAKAERAYADWDGRPETANAASEAILAALHEPIAE